MTNLEKALLWAKSFLDSKDYMYLVPKPLMRLIYEVLSSLEAKELTLAEWREWKTNPKRDPICILWEHDTSPIWTLNPNDIHEPALLMGELKLFNGKPTFEQCKNIRWKVVK